MTHPRILFCVVLATVVGCSPAAVDERPPFVDQLIARFEAEAVGNPPRSIWRYNYLGRLVYYVPPVCCDVPSELYDSDGTLICGPDGGLTGRGDGKCPDFFDTRTDERRVWHDQRRRGG